MKRTKNNDVEVLKIDTSKHLSILMECIQNEFSSDEVLINKKTGTIIDYSGSAQLSLDAETINEDNDYYERKNGNNDWDVIPKINSKHFDDWLKKVGYESPIRFRELDEDHKKLWEEEKEKIAQEIAEELIREIKNQD